MENYLSIRMFFSQKIFHNEIFIFNKLPRNVEKEGERMDDYDRKKDECQSKSKI